MTSEIVDIIPAKDRCQECHGKTATKLCDFVLGQWGITFYREYHKFKNQNLGLITCDKLLCDDCATDFFAMDMCKGHYLKITGGGRI